MKQIVIIALILATVWGCSDDKVTTPDPVDKDTVDARFETIEAIINYVDYHDLLDTLGDKSKLDSICPILDEYDLHVYPTITKERKRIQVFTSKREVPTELIINVETVLLSRELRDIVIARYGYFPEHQEFKNVEHSRVTIDAMGWSDLGILKNQYSPGAYIVRVKRTGEADRCVPFIQL